MDLLKEKINKISDVEDGFCLTVLDFPSSKSLKYFLDDSYRYVWVIRHFIHDMRGYQAEKKDPWFDLCLPLSAVTEPNKVKVRDMGVSFDFIMSTGEFKEALKNESFHRSAGIRCVQMNSLPPHYFKLNEFKGKELFKQLSMIDTNFLADFPGSDYGRIFHSKKDVMEKFLHNPSIDLNNLP
ncbi:hypothetical protein [Aliidiomarina soli]|uniref:Uncharacterized protein n=1 Tax=Aliidiomarina soli TaxID=1928574 RepID=A0A432WE54_9GAMM|nr:hypothetical protein [Aliidiomarina soli]RUO31142.1 hypothetical protein CWE14_11645 [Aliidiomarina soli]